MQKIDRSGIFGQRNVLLSQFEKMPKTRFVCVVN
jgi:hypothetical protein